MEQSSKGKPVTTSVPSIAIKFHANAEQIEELYASEDEASTGLASSTAAGSNEPENSPLKYFPKLVKRSTSIDITPTTSIDASPQSDPWRFFSDIRGKITKSVEDKITEIKSRNVDEGSPLKTTSTTKASTAKDSKDNSSGLSDSEDLSESSISKTCGIVSTTEGVEMSSDDDTPSMEKDKALPQDNASVSAPPFDGGLRQRFRMLRHSKSSPTKEGSVTTSSLRRLYNINTERIEQALPADPGEVESGVDALEASNLILQVPGEYEEKVLRSVENEFDNITVDQEGFINVREVTGLDVSQAGKVKTFFAPIGFVDLRQAPPTPPKSSNNILIPLLVIVSLAISYYAAHMVSKFCAGLILGTLVTYSYFAIKSLLESPASNPPYLLPTTQEIYQVPAIEEFQPVPKYEGWVNEFPKVYNPLTYHVSQTQSVFIRLQGNLLRISNTKTKIPKRALWNEPRLKPTFTHHRIYNLLGAKVTLLPLGLNKKRHWSKKYPICITLNKDQMNFDIDAAESKFKEEDEEERPPRSLGKKSSTTPRGSSKSKKRTSVLFSKLTEEEEEYEMESADTSRSHSPETPDDQQKTREEEPCLQEIASIGSYESLSEFNINDFTTTDFTTLEEGSTETKLYIFGRTGREKEDWFRKFAAATHSGANIPINDALLTNASISDTLITNATVDMNYVKFMLLFNKSQPVKQKKKKEKEEVAESSQMPLLPETPSVESMPSQPNLDISNETLTESSFADIMWVNALIGRILFDCLNDDGFTEKVQYKIQRKLAAIKLPYFIESLVCTELKLGQTPPFFHRATKPLIDDRGVWVDVDITYEGLIVMMLKTKLNLMKLKQPNSDKQPAKEGRAMFNSDLEDSPESTTDEDGAAVYAAAAAQEVDPNYPLDSMGMPHLGLGGTSNASKKFIKMVDRIAESRIFQRATEIGYIKKAMEGVSNTDLRLKVEIKRVIGTLAINIPPPPSDRIWIGFRPTPELSITAQPIVGERNITYMRVTTWIEKKLRQEFQKVLVIPNMEDLVIPVMNQQLPQ